jgi:hypothetical protein
VLWGCVLLSALFGGCQAVQTRSASPYYEHDGMWCGDYATGPEGARIAALTALTELNLPVDREGPEHHGLFIDTRTPDHFEARIVLTPLRHTEGTRIGVRVGGFGTHPAVCERLLDAITRQLEAAPHAAPVPIGAVPPLQSPSAGPSRPPQPVPPERQDARNGER